MAENEVKAEEVKTDTEIKTEDTEVKPVYKGALGDQLDRYKTKSNGNGKEIVKDDKTKVMDDKKYDYSFFKDVDDAHYTKVDEYLKSIGQEGNKELRYQISMRDNDIKKNQRLISEREKTINELKAKSPEKYEEFLTELRKDATGAWKKYQKDFDLPEPAFLVKQVASGGSVEDRLKQWQDAELVKTVSKKHKISEEDFVFSSDEAYKVGTPSYDWRVATEKKEKELFNEYENTQTSQKQALEKLSAARIEDLQFLKNTYFPAPEQESEFAQYLTAIDDMTKKMQEGDFSATGNPFALRHLFRGIHHDALVKREVDKAVADIHKQYNTKGLYLPNEKEEVTDATKLKGNADIQTVTNTKKAEYSPFERSRLRSAKQ